jgi:rubredoxin
MYWLGIYRRNELFNISFLKDVCSLCLKTRIGQLYTTPWKSILIKGIDQADRNDWGYILDQYCLNIRHASNELNWQVEDLCEEGLALKQQLVREFEEADLRTYRLSFAIKTQPKTGLPGSVIIRVHPSGDHQILHTADFNPNSKNYISYKVRVKRDALSKHLIELCNTYYNKESTGAIALTAPVAEIEQLQEITSEIHACKHYKTHYDPTYGDDAYNIPSGTLFTDIIAGYTCPVCEADKNSFELVFKS